MAISKVVYKSSASAQGVTWIDATPATAAAADIISPKTAMLADGVVTQGTGSGGGTPSGNINITQAGVTDVTNYATATVPQGEVVVSSNEGYYSENGNIKWHYQPKAGIDTGEGDGAPGYLGDFLKLGTNHIFNVVPSNTTVTPTTSPQTIGGANYMMQGAVTVAATPTGTSKNAQVVQGTTRTNSSTLTAIGEELTVSKTGTYDIYYSCLRTNTSSSYTWASRLYIDGVAYGTSENTTWTNNQQNIHLANVSLTLNQKLRVYGRETRGASYYVCAPMLAIIEQ